MNQSVAGEEAALSLAMSRSVAPKQAVHAWPRRAAQRRQCGRSGAGQGGRALPDRTPTQRLRAERALLSCGCPRALVDSLAATLRCIAAKQGKMPSASNSAASSGEPPPTNGAQQHGDSAAASTATAPTASTSAASATFTALASTAATRVMDVYNTYPVTRYEKLNKIGEGTYGTVCQTRRNSTLRRRCSALTWRAGRQLTAHCVPATLRAQTELGTR